VVHVVEHRCQRTQPLAIAALEPGLRRERIGDERGQECGVVQVTIAIAAVLAVGGTSVTTARIAP
jgi:hypothetical protein